MIKKQIGLTLVELLITLAIVVILSLIVLPDLKHMLEEAEHTQAVNQLISALNMARGHAVRSGKAVSVCSVLNLCDPSMQSKNLTAFIDNNKDGKMANSVDLLVQYKVSRPLYWKFAIARRKPYITFLRNGSAAGSNGTFTLCRDGIPKRQVIVSLSGRIRSQKAALTTLC